jgi:hypothetical protein
MMVELVLRHLGRDHGPEGRDLRGSLAGSG